MSRRYFEDINSSNTVINNTVINNYYNNTNVTNNVYVNRQVPGAVVAVPRTVFAQSQPVSSAMVRVSGQSLPKSRWNSCRPSLRRNGVCMVRLPGATSRRRPACSSGQSSPAPHRRRRMSDSRPNNRNSRRTRANRSTTQRANN